jgi:3-hydroxyacyl-[acyl-carrier-protein] dehydratase
MFKDSLYFIKQVDSENNRVIALIELNADHEIFKGHFPSQPVLPGVCMLQIIKEILEATITISLQLAKAHEIKFLRMIQPKNEALEISIQHESADNTAINVSAAILINNITCCKLKALFERKR